MNPSPVLAEAELRAIREIFFLSTTRTSWPTRAERERFFETWTGYYLGADGGAFVLLDSLEGQIAGYLMGAADSQAARTYYSQRVRSYELFSDLFTDFPAHFHLNVHPDFRSRGVGERLAQHFFQEMRRQGAKGVHIVTSPASRNRRFYQRLGLTYEVERPWNGANLLFMGMPL